MLDSVLRAWKSDSDANFAVPLERNYQKNIANILLSGTDGACLHLIRN